MFGRVQAFQTITGATQYLLTARGVFKETTVVRGRRPCLRPRWRHPGQANKDDPRSHEAVSRTLFAGIGTLLRPLFKALRDHRDGVDLGRVVDLFSVSIFGALG